MPRRAGSGEVEGKKYLLCVFIKHAPAVMCWCVLLGCRWLNSGFRQTFLMSGQELHSAHPTRSYRCCLTHLLKQCNIFYSPSILTLHASMFYNVHMGFGMVVIMGWTS